MSTAVPVAPAVAAPPSPVRVPRAGAERLRWGLLGVGTVVAAWEVLARSGAVPRRYLPTTGEIADALVGLLGESATWVALADTLIGWALGFGTAVVGGVVLGFAVGLHPVVRALTASTIDFLRPVPSVAFVPVVVLLLGTGAAARWSLTVYAALWPVLLQVVHGIREVDPVARDTARVLGLGPVARLRDLVWPTVLPSLLTGVRLAASVALVLCVATELIVGTPGLGKEIALARDGAALPQMYALVVVAGLLGLAVNAALALPARALLHRYPPDLAGRPA